MSAAHGYDRDLLGAGMPTAVNRAMSSVRARTAEIDRCLRGSPSDTMVESARRRLGELMEAAGQLRALLPDRDGLRDGQACQRAARALRVLEDARLGQLGGFGAEQVAALLEITPVEAAGWLHRAEVKGWTRKGAEAEGFLRDRPWALTPEGKAFTR